MNYAWTYIMQHRWPKPRLNFHVNFSQAIIYHRGGTWLRLGTTIQHCKTQLLNCYFSQLMTYDWLAYTIQLNCSVVISPDFLQREHVHNIQRHNYPESSTPQSLCVLTDGLVQQWWLKLRAKCCITTHTMYNNCCIQFFFNRCSMQLSMQWMRAWFYVQLTADCCIVCARLYPHCAVKVSVSQIYHGWNTPKSFSFKITYPNILISRLCTLRRTLPRDYPCLL